MVEAVTAHPDRGDPGGQQGGDEPDVRRAFTTLMVGVGGEEGRVGGRVTEGDVTAEGLGDVPDALRAQRGPKGHFL